MVTIPLTRDQLEKKRRELALHGIAMLGDQGRIEYTGVTLDMKYLAQNQILEIRIVYKPWLVPESIIEGKIRELFR